jgi:hypothetical protein
MDRGERLRDGGAHAKCLVDVEDAAVVEAIAERLAANVLHREPEHARALVGDDLEEANDVGMIDAAQRTRLFDRALANALELRPSAVGRDGLREPVELEELQRDGAELDAAVLLRREKDGRKAALAERSDDPERTETTSFDDTLDRRQLPSPWMMTLFVIE